MSSMDGDDDRGGGEYVAATGPKPTNPNQSQSHDACTIVSFATFVAQLIQTAFTTGARVAGRANRASDFRSPTRYILVTAKSASDYLRANIR